MDILNKFENIEIDQFNVLSEDDKQFCESIQTRYEKTLDVYKQLHELYQKGKDEEAGAKDIEIFYSDYSHLYLRSLDIFEKVRSLNSSFVSEIYSCFANKYKIKLDRKEAPERKNYDDVLETEALNYKTYIDDILEQLEGLGFEDFRIQQLKQDIKEFCFNSYKQEWNLEIKSDTIKFSDLLYWSFDARWDNDHRLNHAKKLKVIECALGWFEEGRESGFWQFNIFDKYNLHWNEIEDLITIGSPKIKSVKLYKNGRVDIKFQAPSFAREFAKTWCGYTAIAEKGA